jgi:hypothetical protein
MMMFLRVSDKVFTTSNLHCTLYTELSTTIQDKKMGNVPFTTVNAHIDGDTWDTRRGSHSNHYAQYSSRGIVRRLQVGLIQADKPGLGT